MTMLLLRDVATAMLVLAAALFVGLHYFAWMAGRLESPAPAVARRRPPSDTRAARAPEESRRRIGI